MAKKKKEEVTQGSQRATEVWEAGGLIEWLFAMVRFDFLTRINTNFSRIKASRGMGFLIRVDSCNSWLNWF